MRNAWRTRCWTSLRQTKRRPSFKSLPRVFSPHGFFFPICLPWAFSHPKTIQYIPSWQDSQGLFLVDLSLFNSIPKKNKRDPILARLTLHALLEMSALQWCGPSQWERASAPLPTDGIFPQGNLSTWGTCEVVSLHSVSMGNSEYRDTVQQEYFILFTLCLCLCPCGKNSKKKHRLGMPNTNQTNRTLYFILIYVSSVIAVLCPSRSLEVELVSSFLLNQKWGTNNWRQFRPAVRARARTFFYRGSWSTTSKFGWGIS